MESVCEAGRTVIPSLSYHIPSKKKAIDLAVFGILSIRIHNCLLADCLLGGSNMSRPNLGEIVELPNFTRKTRD
jgi:hypothetical protein